MAPASVRLAVAVGALLLACASAQTATTCPGNPGCNLQQAICKQIPDSSKYSCSCNAGWSGSNCTQVAAPAPAPAAATIVGNSSECTVSCMHGACVKYSNGTSGCDCSGTAYIGPYCSVEPGAPSWSGGSRQCNGGTGCQNGGRCIQQQDSNNVYICQCSGIPYSGRACEIPDNQVAQPPASLATPTPTQTSTENSVGSSTAAATSLSGGAVVGIVAIVLAAFLIVLAGIVFWRRRRSGNGRFEKFAESKSMEIQAPYGASSIQGRI